jgi:hypothetical protein
MNTMLSVMRQSLNIGSIKMGLLGIFVLFLFQHASAQNVLFSEIQKKDNKNIKFEILGKVEGHYLVYKNISRTHFLSTYDAQMQLIETNALDFLPENLFDIDFIRYPDYFIVLYQYQKNKRVFCNAAKVDIHGKLKQPISILNFTDIGFFANQKIFKTVYSEDKQQILVFKKNVKNDIIFLEAKLYDTGFSLKDSVFQQYGFNTRNDNFTDCSIDNLGNLYFIKESTAFNGDNINSLELFQHRFNQIGFINMPIDLTGYFVTGSCLKVDNINKKILINAFYLSEKQDIPEGLFSAVIEPENFVVEKSIFNLFSEDIKKSLQSNKYKNDNQQVILSENILLKKNGSFILMAEDNYTELAYNNNQFRNSNFYDPSTGYASNDYFLYNQNNNNYRSFNSFNNSNSLRYYYKDIVMVGIGEDLQMEWVNQIKKNQVDVDQDNFLSFTTINLGTQIQYVFIDKDPQHEIISMQGLFSDGSLKRYPAIKSRQMGYEFMPRLSKQVGSKELLMPFIYLGKIGFAKIMF